MASRRPTRFLFLDDSGHPAPNYATRAVVIGGFSVASGDVAAINRRLRRRQGRDIPERGRPSQWEVKAAHMIRPHLWKRPRNQQLASEIVDILRGSRLHRLHGQHLQGAHAPPDDPADHDAAAAPSAD